jgi:hypothetical protein
LHREPNARNTESAGRSGFADVDRREFDAAFLQGIRQQAERRFPQRSVLLRADARLADATWRTSAMNQTYGSRRALKQRAPQRQGQVN